MDTNRTLCSQPFLAHVQRHCRVYRYGGCWGIPGPEQLYWGLSAALEWRLLCVNLEGAYQVSSSLHRCTSRKSPTRPCGACSAPASSSWWSPESSWPTWQVCSALEPDGLHSCDSVELEMLTSRQASTGRCHTMAPWGHTTSSPVTLEILGHTA